MMVKSFNNAVDELKHFDTIESTLSSMEIPEIDDVCADMYGYDNPGGQYISIHFDVDADWEFNSHGGGGCFMSIVISNGAIEEVSYYMPTGYQDGNSKEDMCKMAEFIQKQLNAGEVMRNIITDILKK